MPLSSSEYCSIRLSITAKCLAQWLSDRSSGVLGSLRGQPRMAVSLAPQPTNRSCRLTHTYLTGYTSINSQQVLDSMPNDHDVLFRTLADPTRRAIFERLCLEGEQTVGALTARAGVSQPAVSKHLGVLRQAGLVRDRHEGRQTHYSAQLGALAPLIDWTSQMAGFWQSRFDQLEDLLKRMDQ